MHMNKRIKLGLPLYAKSDTLEPRRDEGDEYCPRCGYWVIKLNDRYGWCGYCMAERKKQLSRPDVQGLYSYDRCGCGGRKRSDNEACNRCRVASGWYKSQGRMMPPRPSCECGKPVERADGRGSWRSKCARCRKNPSDATSKVLQNNLTRRG